LSQGNPINLISLEQRLAKAVELMDAALYLSTGLQELQRKVVTYYTLATHSLPHVDMFPLLVLRGKMGTGKSETLKIVAKFAYQPHPFNPGGKTLPVIREELAASYEGTAIIEEADQSWKDGSSAFERLLSGRYQRQSAETGLMQKHGDQWVPTTKRTFGATALHRRIPFNDSALDGRSITIRYRADFSRRYTEVSDDLPWIVEGSELMKDLVFVPTAIDQPQGVAPRIFNTYRPLFVIARLCGDEAFAQLILESLMLDTAQLKEAQSVEPDGLVLRAIISIVGIPPCFANIKFGDIAKCIWDNHREPFQPKQIGGLARELGFITKLSHGWTVVVPTPATLLKACHECGYEDEETIAELKQHVLGSGGRVEEVE
jgi:hypothetical protein